MSSVIRDTIFKHFEAQNLLMIVTVSRRYAAVGASRPARPGFTQVAACARARAAHTSHTRTYSWRTHKNEAFTRPIVE